jgi:hypothetical protein
MQNQIIDWPSAVTEIFKSLFYALTIIVPVLITAVVSWKISRQQLTLKSVELNAQTTFKAREYVFELARRRLDKHREDVAAATKALGELLPIAANVKNEEQLQALVKGLQGIRDCFLLFTDVGNIASLLESQGLYSESIRQEVKRVGEILALDLKEITPNNAYEACLLYVQMFDTWQGMRSLVLESVCRNVFSDYLPGNLIKDYLPRPESKDLSVGEHTDSSKTHGKI